MPQTLHEIEMYLSYAESDSIRFNKQTCMEFS